MLMQGSNCYFMQTKEALCAFYFYNWKLEDKNIIILEVLLLLLLMNRIDMMMVKDIEMCNVHFR